MCKSSVKDVIWQLEQKEVISSKLDGQNSTKSWLMLLICRLV